MTLRYLLEKEFKQFFRNPFLPRMVVMFPVMVLLIMPLAATMDVQNVKIAVVDNDRTSLSERLAREIGASDYFRLQGTGSSYAQALEKVEYGTADIILEIPYGFERGLVQGGAAQVQISANAVNGTKGSLGSGYLSAILQEFAAGTAAEKGKMPASGGSASDNAPGPTPGQETFPGTDAILAASGSTTAPGAAPQITIATTNRFNLYLNYRSYMIPALMVILLIMMCGFLPALNIVGEKEKGTIEQMNVTPVGKFTFILSKLIPYWLMGLVVLSLGFLLARLAYGLSPAGNLLLVYGFAGLFILAMSGLGLIVSNYSSTLQQAMFVMFFFVIVFQLMSGLLTPVQSMPEWARWLTIINPPRYLIDVMRAVYLRGAGFGSLLPEFFALCGFVLFFNTWAVFSYKKNA